jgi:hypothetical protein
VTEKSRKRRDLVILDRESWLIIILEYLSISELLMEGWIGVRSRSEILGDGSRNRNRNGKRSQNQNQNRNEHQIADLEQKNQRICSESLDGANLDLRSRILTGT